MIWYHIVPNGAKVDVAFTEHPLIQKALRCLSTEGMLKGVVQFLSRMQTHVVGCQAAPSKAASELWKQR